MASDRSVANPHKDNKAPPRAKAEAPPRAKAGQLKAKTEVALASCPKQASPAPLHQFAAQIGPPPRIGEEFLAPQFLSLDDKNKQKTQAKAGHLKAKAEAALAFCPLPEGGVALASCRSEERRVGKECSG